MKVCNKCKVNKEFTLFTKDSRNKDGLQGICNSCKDEDKKLRRAARAKAQNYIQVDRKTCNKCQVTKPIEGFFKDAAMSDGHSTICKECKRQNVYAWREKNKEKYNADQRAYLAAHPEMRYGVEIKRRYGCTLEQYNEMLVKQEGKCALCDTLHNPAIKKGRLYVDHCHSGGQVRALLCGACNSMLGYAKDDPAVLAKAIDYLAKHR
jgi:hypothetical protein